MDLNKHATKDEARMFASAVDTALDILKGEIIQVLSHEQYDYYEGFVAWILDPDDNWEAIGFNF